MLPVKDDGTPLCFLTEYQDNPHAYVKLWKHHAAQDKANKINEMAEKMHQTWLHNYGGKISSEWAFPKLWEVLDEAPNVYAAMDHWVEAADWIVWQLCGKQTRNSCTAGYKAMYNKQTGYPSSDYFAALDERLRHVINDKFSCPVSPLGQKAGSLTDEMAKKLGLLPGIAVSIGNVDAHVCVPAVGITQEGKMLAIIGTSTCHMVLGREEKQVPGMCGVVEDGILPGFAGYEAGQSCVGDHFAWLVDHCVPEHYVEAAKQEGISVHEHLTNLAAKLKPGQSGLLALDFWNGNRSILVDADLTGLMLGMTLQTNADEMYRALIEVTAYGTRIIVENFREYGVPVDEFVASGGISQKNTLAMQIYADVLNMPVHVAAAAQGPALGSAMFAAVAAGKEKGGYDDIEGAVAAMAIAENIVYEPNEAAAKVYDLLFMEYRRLHDYFGRGENDVMKRLKRIKIQNS